MISVSLDQKSGQESGPHFEAAIEGSKDCRPPSLPGAYAQPYKLALLLPRRSKVEQAMRPRLRRGQFLRFPTAWGSSLDETPQVLGQHERMSVRTYSWESLQYELREQEAHYGGRWHWKVVGIALTNWNGRGHWASASRKAAN